MFCFSTFEVSHQYNFMSFQHPRNNLKSALSGWITSDWLTCVQDCIKTKLAELVKRNYRGRITDIPSGKRNTLPIKYKSRKTSGHAGCRSPSRPTVISFRHSSRGTSSPPEADTGRTIKPTVVTHAGGMLVVAFPRVWGFWGKVGQISPRLRLF